MHPYFPKYVFKIWHFPNPPLNTRKKELRDYGRAIEYELNRYKLPRKVNFWPFKGWRNATTAPPPNPSVFFELPLDHTSTNYAIDRTK